MALDGFVVLLTAFAVLPVLNGKRLAQVKEEAADPPEFRLAEGATRSGSAP
ncbi:hypothetical protein [Streptomyces stackebrandtii]|uniref:hypothetical protein n=1 Tax=Streptomyces stackebrandtii TaxID=3051177 RepID=UPI0028DCE4EB|nr:hypothetical protein [Streptomyces sp. DSM 40976]